LVRKAIEIVKFLENLEVGALKKEERKCELRQAASSGMNICRGPEFEKHKRAQQQLQETHQ
jgi:hypothetical protein